MQFFRNDSDPDIHFGDVSQKNGLGDLDLPKSVMTGAPKTFSGKLYKALSTQRSFQAISIVQVVASISIGSLCSMSFSRAASATDPPENKSTAVVDLQVGPSSTPEADTQTQCEAALERDARIQCQAMAEADTQTQCEAALERDARIQCQAMPEVDAQTQSEPALEVANQIPEESNSHNRHPDRDRSQAKIREGTKIEEILKWEDISDQYVLGYGKDPVTGNLIPFAVYDKTLSVPFFSHFWSLLVLGGMGISDFNAANLSRMLKEGALEEEPRQPEKMRTPIKIIDIRKKESSYKKAVFWSSITTLLKSGLNLIPFYGPPQLCAALLERVFDFIELLYLHHHSQALLLVIEALQDHIYSPFISPRFSKGDLENAAFYLIRSNTMLSAIFGNLFSDKNHIVQNHLDKINYARNLGALALRERELILVPLARTYFAVGIKRSKKTGKLTKLKIYSLSYSKLARKTKPHAAVDFLKPGRELVKRNVFQTVLFGSNFIYFPVPGVAGVVKLFYKELVIREVHRRQMWENGLLAHLNHSDHEIKNILINQAGLEAEVAEEYEKQALRILEKRRGNPIEFVESEIQLHSKKVENWIKAHDPEYVPWAERHLPSAIIESDRPQMDLPQLLEQSPPLEVPVVISDPQ